MRAYFDLAIDGLEDDVDIESLREKLQNTLQEYYPYFEIFIGEAE